MVKFNNPFEKKGNWYKGNIHLHTTNSDGTLKPEELCKIYKKAGYDFISITDHHRITIVENVPSGLLTIQGAEMNNDDSHFIGLNLKEVFNEQKLSHQEIIDEINQQNALSIIAHPYWSALTSGDLLKLRDYIGIEVYNNTCEKRWGKGYSTAYWDGILQNGKKVYGFASDDAHHESGKYIEDDILGSFIMVKAKELTIEEIMSSIKNGYFYSSTGPIIKNLKIEEGKIYVNTSPVVTIDFICYGHRGIRFSGKSKNLEEIEYEIRGEEKYIRIEITDKNHKKAWTNPIFLY